MARYTVRDVRECIEGLDNETPLFGFVISPLDIEVWGKNRADGTDDDDTEGYRVPTPEEWARIVENAEGYSVKEPWNTIWELINDAIGEEGLGEG